MVTDEAVLSFFREQLPVLGLLPTQNNLLSIDDILQEYTEPEDLLPVISKYEHVFGVDISSMNIDNYYPWKVSWFFRKWFTKKPIKQTSHPLTVRMFSESAKAGRWLYE
ncbi:hypothetical protein J2X14_001928 [Pantoea alhagi]|uniref:DUF1493 family protein n=1 Tax=Mixta sp. BE291 TaxID=3158787 RepID=UPI0028678D33|nr:hypothetical protein [Pantoea alhagi]